MFGKLREKIKGWFGSKEEETEEKAIEEKKPVEKKPEKTKVEKSVTVKKEKKRKEPKSVRAEKPQENAEEALEETRVEPAADTQPHAETLAEEPTHEAVESRAEELIEEVEEAAIEKARETEEVFEKKEVKEEVAQKKGFFGLLAQKLTTSELTESDFHEAFDEFELTLLEHNVALSVVDAMRTQLGTDLIGKRFSAKDVGKKLEEALRRAIEALLIEPEDVFAKISAKKDSPFVMLFFGINGAGKTTSIAKLAYALKEKGISCVLAAGDTFRAASIEQLSIHAEKVGVPIVKGEYGKDPSAVAFDAIAYAKKNRIQTVLIDTAGRMYTRQNLMREMEKIVKVSKPDLKVFVGESITGNDATEQAKMFNETAGIDGIILSKADVDEKAGTILSVSHVTGKPILFLGIGQEYKDLEVFSKQMVLKNLGLS